MKWRLARPDEVDGDSGGEDVQPLTLTPQERTKRLREVVGTEESATGFDSRARVAFFTKRQYCCYFRNFI